MAARKKAGTAVARRKSSDAAAIEAALVEQRKHATAAIGTSAGVQAKINDDLTIELPNGAKGEEIGVVVIDFHARNTQYDNPPNANNPSPPDCWALGEPASVSTGTRKDIHLSLVPHERVQNPKEADCNSCYFNEFGTGGRSGRGKKCNNRYWLVISNPSDPEGPLCEVNVMVSAKAAWETYVATLAAWNKLPLEVITLLSATRVNEQKVWVFTNGGDNPNYIEHAGRQAEARELLNAGYQMVPTGNLPKATKKKAARRRRAA